MSAPISSLFLPCLTALVLAAPSLAGGVRIVERPDVPPFATIQVAIDNAFDGETLLVGQGTYAGFTIANKAVVVVGEGAGLVSVTETVTVRDLASSGAVLLENLTLRGGPVAGLVLANDTGHVRVQGCSITGLGSTNDPPPAAAGVSITDCPSVAFVSCTVTGVSFGPCWDCLQAFAGGNGITATNGGVALYDCTVIGGNGTSFTLPLAGAGGDGFSGVSWGLVASGSTIRGGKGGDADDYYCGYGGSGGDGIQVVSAQSHLLDNSIVGGGGGGGGFPCGSAGGPGLAIRNISSFVDLLAGTRRKLTVPAIASDGAPVSATVVGEAGDKVFVMMARKPASQFIKSMHGTCFVPLPTFFTSLPLAVLPVSGPANLSIPVPNLPIPDVGKVLYFQVLIVDAAGLSYLSSPQHVLLLNRDAAPDCNGNGVLDLVDTVAGLGTTPDIDNNFIPDTCSLPTERWVDVNAPPGGNGTQSAPFQNIHAGVDSALSGHTVIVRDGYYGGSQNRDMDFGGREIVVKSEHGQANCIIDCQLDGRAFVVKSPATLAARIQGFTILNGVGGHFGGAIHAEQVSVWDCTLEGCSGEFGGAIDGTRLDVRRCVFRANNSGGPPNSGFGGALYLSHNAASGAGSVIEGCLFEGNSSAKGGALSLQGNTGQVVVSHCTFFGNASGPFGGAVECSIGVNATQGSRFDDCLFAANTAASFGGAISVRGTGFCSITGSTFTGNRTLGYGGAVAFEHIGPGVVANCVMWNDNAATNGSEVSLRSSLAQVTVSWSDVRGGQAAVAVVAGTLNWGAGNIDVDPAFVDPDGADNDAMTFGDNDYTLALASPCIDAADNTSIPMDLADVDGDGNTTEPVPFDLLGNARRADVPSVPDTGNGSAPIVDMGTYERP